MNSKREFGGGDVVDAKIPKKMDPAEEEYKVKQRSNVIACLSIHRSINNLISHSYFNRINL